jgi:hypothetical protein
LTIRLIGHDRGLLAENLRALFADLEDIVA